MLARCEQVMREVRAQMGAELREVNGEDDYVPLVHYPPKLSISTLVNRLKGVSGHYLRKEFTGTKRVFMHGQLWSPSYFAAACGGAPLVIIANSLQLEGRYQTPAAHRSGRRPPGRPRSARALPGWRR